jgi:hypothetical protein
MQETVARFAHVNVRHVQHSQQVQQLFDEINAVLYEYEGSLSPSRSDSACVSRVFVQPGEVLPAEFHLT